MTAWASRKSTNRIDYEQAPRPLAVMPKEYPGDHLVPLHRHERGQLIYAVSGVMEIEAVEGLWLLPPQRALWMPGGIEHLMRARGPVSLRTLYVSADACPAQFPVTPKPVQVSALLRELLVRAATIPIDYDETGRDARILRMILDEIEWATEPVLHLPLSGDPRLLRICRAIIADPGDGRSLTEWGKAVGASSRTIARLFQAEMSVPFLTWRQQARILAALPRLAAGEPVTVIATDLGYDTPGAFAAMFRRLTGTRPSHYFERSSS